MDEFILFIKTLGFVETCLFLSGGTLVGIFSSMLILGFGKKSRGHLSSFLLTENVKIDSPLKSRVLIPLPFEPRKSFAFPFIFSITTPPSKFFIFPACIAALQTLEF